MKPYRLLALLAAFVLAVASCEPDEPEKITVSVSPTSLNFNADGGSQQISVTSNGAWTVRIDGGWMTVSSVSGTGNGSFDLSVGTLM